MEQPCPLPESVAPSTRFATPPRARSCAVGPGRLRSGCIPWNIFREGAVTQPMLDYLTLPLSSRGFTEQTIVSGHVAGNLGDTIRPFAVTSSEVRPGIRTAAMTARGRAPPATPSAARSGSGSSLWSGDSGGPRRPVRGHGAYRHRPTTARRPTRSGSAPAGPSIPTSACAPACSRRSADPACANGSCRRPWAYSTWPLTRAAVRSRLQRRDGRPAATSSTRPPITNSSRPGSRPTPSPTGSSGRSVRPDPQPTTTPREAAWWGQPIS